MNRSGLTLLELIIVLTILAVLVGVATVATEGVVEQSRTDASRRTLENVRDAIVGPADAEPGTAGFVAHMGRAPTSLDELVKFPATAPPLARPIDVPIDSDDNGTADATLHVGWRGPYLRLPAQQNEILDGLGRPIQFASGPGPDDLKVFHLGAPDLPVIVYRNDYTGSVTIHVREMTMEGEKNPSSGTAVEVRLWRVKGDTPSLSAIFEPLAISSEFAATWSGEMGPIVVRAIGREGGQITKASDILYHTVARTSAPKRLVLRPIP